MFRVVRLFLVTLSKYVHILMLYFICKYLIRRTYQRDVQSFGKGGVGKVPLLLQLAAVQRRKRGCAQVFCRDGQLGAIPLTAGSFGYVTGNQS